MSELLPSAISEDISTPRLIGPGCITIASGAARSPGLRQVYEIRGRTYRLRTSEIATMVEAGKFRAIAQEDLTEFAYGSDKGRMRPDVENLIRQGLVQMESGPVWTSNLSRAVTADGISRKKSAPASPSTPTKKMLRNSGAYWISAN